MAQQGNSKGSEPEATHVFDNETNFTTAEESSALATEPQTSSGNRSGKATGPRTELGKQRTSRNAITHGVYYTVITLKGESRAEYARLLARLRKVLKPKGALEDFLVEKLATLIWRHRRLIQAEGAEIQKSINLMEWEQRIRNIEQARRTDFSSLMQIEPGLFFKIDNPFALNQCLALLAELRAQIAENGFSDSDIEILKQLYGDDDQLHLGGDLHNEYLNWSETASGSETERLKQGHATPEECKQNVLMAINREIRRLREHQKVEAMSRSVPQLPALDRLLRREASLERSFDRTLSQLERLQRTRMGQPVLPKLEVRHSLS
jgi:hypothetical protein